MTRPNNLMPKPSPEEQIAHYATACKIWHYEDNAQQGLGYVTYERDVIAYAYNHTKLDEKHSGAVEYIAGQIAVWIWHGTEEAAQGLQVMGVKLGILGPGQYEPSRPRHELFDHSDDELIERYNATKA